MYRAPMLAGSFRAPPALARREKRSAPLLLVGLTVLAALGCVGEIDDRAAGPGPLGPDVLRPPPLHRLNQLEYDNTVRDLLGTRLRPAQAFPPDSESNGFDNQIDALSITPTLLDQYYSAARAVIDDALDDRPEYLHRVRPAEVGAGGFPIGDLWRLQGNVLEVSVTVPAGGATASLVAGASVVSSAPAPVVRFELDGAHVADFTVGGSAAAVEAHSHALTLGAGVHVLRYAPINFVNDAPANISNDVIVRWVELRADTIVPGAGRELVYVCTPASDDDERCYREILHTFATRAWRRPLEPDDASGLDALFAELRAEGETAEQATRLVMRAILTSPRFVFRVARAEDATHALWLDPYVLASRLSYFLWSTMPDERLLAAAASGRLTSDEGLADTVAWMLADERAQGFLDGFVTQWLSTRGLATIARSETVYPGFDAPVREALAMESELFVFDFLANGQPVTALLRPDFAYLNDALASHYGVAPVGSDALVRVDAERAGRAGLLSLGAWLAVESDSEHSSPIKRGRWVSDRILCQSIPSPPAGLAVEPIVPEEGVTVREALERHRSDPTCASCHTFLDVLGMGFERFDGVGRRRADEVLDTLGELPDGTTFEDADELARVIDEERFVACVAQKLFTYSMGRPLAGDLEREELTRIARDVTREGRSLPELIGAIARMTAFRAPQRGPRP